MAHGNPFGVNQCPEDVMDELVARYVKGETAQALAKESGFSPGAMFRHIKKRGIPVRGRGTHTRREHPIREDAFDGPTPEAAYWIGFLMADGSVSQKGLVSLGLAEIDKASVEAFRAFLGSDNQVDVRKNKGGFGGGGLLASFRIQSPPLAAALARYGVTHLKALRAGVIGLEDDPDFWRGVIDGDGSLHIRPKGRPGDVAIILCGGQILMEQFRDFIDSRLPGGARKVTSRGKIWYHQVSGSRAIRLTRIIYDRPGPVLARKAETAKRIMALVDRPSDDRPKRWKTVVAAPAP